MADDSRLRVLILTDEMEVGGSQRQIVHIARSLDPSRFAVTVGFFRHTSFFVDELRAAGIPVVQIEKLARIDLRFVARLRRFLAEGRFDVIHCFSFTAELWGALARRLLPAATRPTLLSSVRGTYEWYAHWQWRLKRWVSLESARVVANSRHGGEYAFERMKLDPARLAVIYNGVAAPTAVPADRLSVRESLGLRADECVALFVGRLIVHKDVPTLLRSMRRVADEGTPLRLLIAGDGPLRAELEASAQSLGLQERVHFLGQRSDTPALMHACDMVVLPSLREGLSNVILEAMQAGRAVIASTAGGNRELVEHEKTGLLVDIGDDAALAQSLLRLTRDANLREALGGAGALRARSQFGVPAMAQSFETLYRAVVTTG